MEGSTSVNPTANETDVASDISKVDGDSGQHSGSEEELISGSAQTHSVFNFAQLAHVMGDRYALVAFFFSLLFGFNVNYKESPFQQI